MTPSPYTQGPPLPPEARADQEQVAPVPPSILAQQGAAAGPKPEQENGIPGGNNGDLKKYSLDMAMQKLMDYKNALQGLVTVMKSVDPESVGLLIPAVEVGKAAEARLSAVLQRAANPSPSMAGMLGGAGPQPKPPGGSSVSGI